jgi:PPK2 family polyphosphate:nucleotide phosphotransferase
VPYARFIAPGSSSRLADFDPGLTDGLKKEEGLQRLETLGKRMGELQEMLYGTEKHSLLIVLQGRDTSGKDGSIKRLLAVGHGPSTRIAGFKAPTENELAHDFLWRVHAETPARGGVTIFNRSHYEDVLAPRVRGLVPPEVWRRRYAHINAFESLLVDEGTIVLKFYLHISKEEQEERLLAREKETRKAWKLNVGDWEDRERWDDFTTAYEEMLARCSTEAAPWWLVPADHKWFRDLAVVETVVAALEPYEGEWRKALDEMGAERGKAVKEYRAAH